MSTLFRELEEEFKLKWQQSWDESPRGAQTKQFYPSITDRLKAKIDITPNFSAIVTGHGKTRAYLQRCKLSENVACPDHGPLDIPLHLVTTTKGKTQEGNIPTGNLANKQTRLNN